MLKGLRDLHNNVLNTEEMYNLVNNPCVISTQLVAICKEKELYNYVYMVTLFEYGKVDIIRVFERS